MKFFIEEKIMRNFTLPALAYTACALYLLPPSVHAQTNPGAATADSAREIIITSSRIATPRRQAGTSISVIDADQISSRGNSSLLEILRAAPAISVSNAGGAGQVSNLRIRGEEGYRTLTLLDGMKLSDPSVTQVQPQLEHLVSSGIDRVEILRGPQGLHFGADAGGVINISTRQHNEQLRAHLDVMSGAFDTKQLSGNISAGNERADFFLSASDYQTAGFNARKADNILRDKDGYDNSTLHSRLGINISERLRLGLVLRDVKGDSAYDGCFHPTNFSSVHDCKAEYQQQAGRVAAEYETDYGNHQLALSKTSTEREYFSLGTPAYAAEGAITRWEYISSVTTFDSFNLVYGADLDEEENADKRRHQLGYYMEYLSNFSDSFFLTAGIRQDDNNDFGMHNSYRVSAARLFALERNDTLKLRASYGTGFRAPSPYEAAYNSGPFASPPASMTTLSEETSKGYELALEYFADSGLWWEAVYFDQRIHDAIYFDLAGFSGYLQETGESLSEGIEISLLAPLAYGFVLDGNMTYNKTRRPDGQQRQLRPSRLGNLGLSWVSADQRLKLAGFYRLAHDSVDVRAGTSIPLDDYSVVDVSARYLFTPGLELYLRMENIADAEYEEILGYNTAGRAAYIGLRLNF
jgi:vitamin B12 transporter